MNQFSPPSLHRCVTIVTEKPIEIFALSDLHGDQEVNFKWIQDHSFSTPNTFSILLIPGDIGTDLIHLEAMFEVLSSRFNSVFFVPGNHELWCQGSSFVNSIHKLEAIFQLCDKFQIKTSPMRIETIDKIDSVVIFPLLSWFSIQSQIPFFNLYFRYHSSWDAEPDPTHPIYLSASERLPFVDRWMDFRMCRWPVNILPQEKQSLFDPPHIAEYFASLNESYLDPTSPLGSPLVQEGDTVISFSHFLPLQALLPEKRFLFEPNLHRVSGSVPLLNQVRLLRPHLHLFGHTHLPMDCLLEGTRFVQWPLGYARERSENGSCEEVGRTGPLLVFQSSRGRGFSGIPPLASESTRWSRHYKETPREPQTTEPPGQWVIDKLTPILESLK